MNIVLTPSYSEKIKEEVKSPDSKLSSSMKVDSKLSKSLKQELVGAYKTGRWSRGEHYRFLEALKKYGKDWKKV